MPVPSSPQGKRGHPERSRDNFPVHARQAVKASVDRLHSRLTQSSSFSGFCDNPSRWARQSWAITAPDSRKNPRPEPRSAPFRAPAASTRLYFYTGLEAANQGGMQMHERPMAIGAPDFTVGDILYLAAQALQERIARMFGPSNRRTSQPAEHEPRRDKHQRTVKPTPVPF